MIVDDPPQLSAELAELAERWHAAGVPAAQVLEVMFGAVARALCEARYPLSRITAELLRVWSERGGRS